MRICGTDDSGWLPVDLTEVAQAIAVPQRLASIPDGATAGGDDRGSLPAQGEPPVTASLPAQAEPPATASLPAQGEPPATEALPAP